MDGWRIEVKKGGEYNREHASSRRKRFISIFPQKKKANAKITSEKHTWMQ